MPPQGSPSSRLTDKLLVADGEVLRELLQHAVGEAVAAVVERHAREVRELRRSLFVQKQLLTAHEAGQVLGGVSAPTVMEYVREKGLPCYRPGKAPLFLIEDLVAWASSFPDTSGAGTLAPGVGAVAPTGPPEAAHSQESGGSVRVGAKRCGKERTAG